jgi:aminoglycoside phosphotransferase (APT) family kinase protein
LARRSVVEFGASSNDTAPARDTGDVERSAITAAAVRRLIAAQFPQWSDLGVVPVDVDGWDNSTFRLGDEMSVRLPNGDGYATQVAIEVEWLPWLAPRLPMPIPEPIAVGHSDETFPLPWSVRRWLPGSPATVDRVDDLERLAVDLAGFLTSLQRLDPSGGPSPGPRNGFRGGALATYDDETVSAITTLAGEIDADRAMATWRAALATSWDRPALWVHGDITGSNLLVVDGRLHAVIDFGCVAVGDPSCDLAIAWTLFTGTSRRTFRWHLDIDDASWARARGWALWKALITLRDDTNSAAQRFGWRAEPRALIEDLLTDS